MLRVRTVLTCVSAISAMAAADAAFTAASADSKFFFNIYGFAQADYIYDVNRVDPDWQDAFRPSKIPTGNDPDKFGSDGQSSLSVKQSRFGVSGDAPVSGGDLGDIKFKFEFDLFGVGDDAGQTTFRLRHAYAEWGPLLAGQTNSVFMDIDTFPNTIDYWGPTGMVFYRNVQIRVTPYRTDNSNFAIAIERPGNDIDGGVVRELDPELGANLQGDEKVPDVTAHYYYGDAWGHVQLAGILRWVGYDTKDTPDNRPSGHKVGWGVNLSGHANVFDTDKLLGSVVYGDGIASYMNDGGVDLAPEGTITPINIRPRAVPLLGIMGYYDHYWSKHLSTSLGYSITQVDNTNLQDPDAYGKGEYASVNLLWTPASDIMVGGELLWGKRTDNNGASGDDLRIQFSVKYSFGTKIEL